MCEKHHLKVICFLLISLSEWACCNGKNRFDALRGSDAIQVTRCDIACNHSRDKRECKKICLREPFEKRGFCPDSYDHLPKFVGACVHYCDQDIDCPSTEKCCEHSCGQTCQPASGLPHEEDLPPIPANLTAREKKKKNEVHLTWDMPKYKNDQQIRYVLEERHHLGLFYNELLLGEWSPMHSSKKTSVNLKNVIRPGYCYQFRVASVNINGTKGFSQESEGFRLTKQPKIEKPTKLRVEKVKEKNGTIWGLVRWNPSDSFIPVQRYKIFWSHRLDERDLKYKSEAVLVKRDHVSENQLFYQLKNLKKNTEYFIQVQAVAPYGRILLKSKMANMLFNTSILADQNEMLDYE